MRLPEEIQMDKAIMFARDLARRVDAYTHNGILTREAYRLIANADDILEFLRQVERHLDELDEMKSVYTPRRENPDQLSLF